jgi:hypothetical protein
MAVGKISVVASSVVASSVGEALRAGDDNVGDLPLRAPRVMQSVSDENPELISSEWKDLRY